MNALWARISRAKRRPGLLLEADVRPRPRLPRLGRPRRGKPPAGRPGRPSKRSTSLASDPSPDVQLQVAIASRKIEGVDPVALLDRSRLRLRRRPAHPADRLAKPAPVARRQGRGRAVPRPGHGRTAPEVARTGGDRPARDRPAFSGPGRPRRSLTAASSSGSPGRHGRSRHGRPSRRSGGSPTRCRPASLSGENLDAVRAELVPALRPLLWSRRRRSTPPRSRAAGDLVEAPRRLPRAARRRSSRRVWTRRAGSRRSRR